MSGFTCGQEDLDAWFRRFSLTDQQAGMSAVFVSEVEGEIGAFYAISTGGIDPQDAPDRATRGVARHPVPVIILTRMGVRVSIQSQGLGVAMLRDACLRVARLSEEVGVRGLLIHAKDRSARDFYMAFAEFEASPSDTMHLLLMMKDLRKAVSG